MANRYRMYYPPVDSVAVLRLTYDDGELRVEGLDRLGACVVDLRFCDVLLTRILYEGIRLKLLKELLETDHALILVDEHSELIDWILEESIHTRDIGQAKHFLVFAGEEIVDVVSLSEPEILGTR